MPAVSTQLHNFIMPATAPARRQAAGPSWFARLASAVFEARARQAEREIARLIESGGGRITDSLEREIGRRLF